MARSRNIKPGFFTNDLLAEIDPLGRILFAGLWTMADRDGRIEDRPKKIKAGVLPFDNCDVDALLNNLAEYGFLLRYSVDGRRYLQVMNWGKHQNPHFKEAQSLIPAPVLERGETEASMGQASGKHQTSPERAVLIPDSLNLIPDSLGWRQQGATTVGRQAAENQNQNNPETLSKTPPNPPPELDPAPTPGIETPSSGENPPEPEPHADAITVRAVGIAVLLRQRGAGVAAGDVRLRSWAERGITDAALLAALETAERRRSDAVSPQPVNAGLLDSILADGGATGPPARASPRNGKQAARDAYLADAAVAAQRHNLDGHDLEKRGGNHERTGEHDISGECARVA